MSPPVGIVAAIASDDLPDDLRAAAKAAGAPRQVARFLDGMALPAFVAGVAALDAAGVTDGERCGLFTVSGWDPDQPQPEIGDEPASYTTVARHYITTASPMTWLRKMVNNALCQLAMTRDLRGPNNHVVGGTGALAAVLTLGQRAIEGGAADDVLIVAYDAPVGHESDHEVDGQACAVVLGPAGSGASPLMVPEVELGSGEGGHGGRAVDTLDALVASAGAAAAAGEPRAARPTGGTSTGGREERTDGG
jgi:hypothetical protein